LKNARHLQTAAPDVLPRDEPLPGFGSRIPDRLLSRLHTGVRPEDLKPYPGLAAALRRSPIPKPRAIAGGPLFQGTFVFVRATFRISSGTASVEASDLNTAIAYTQAAVGPISRYASQYGPNVLSISPSLVPFAANVPTAQFNDQILQGWIRAIVAQGGLPANPCLVVLDPPGVVNTDADPRKGVGGYHNFADVPYIFVNAMGRGFTVPDSANVFALALSHEVAETAVDPRADLANPEVCDPCGPNCQTAWIDYFGDRGSYLATTQSFPPPFAYAFFINAIVRPNAATMCPAPGTACDYGPP
jgi:hypothetical protein